MIERDRPQMTVYAIDREAHQREILRRLFESSGVLDFTSAAAPEELTVVPGREDVVVVEAVQFEALRAHRDGDGPSVIVSAPGRGDARIAECLARGAHAFLTKPFTREGLETALADARAIRKDVAP